jgi:hypothetical protein
VLIDFEWSLDTAGYRLERGRIIGNDGPKRSMRLRDFPPLYPYFARIEQTPKGLLEFVNKFGRLTKDKLTPDGEPVVGDDVRTVLANVKMISEGLGILHGHMGKPPRWLGGKFEYEVPGKLKVSGGIPLRGKLEAWLVPDPVSGKWELQLTPPTLLDAIWLQFGQAITGGTKLRQCQNCGQWFEGRRADAKFHSDACRIEYNNARR